MENKSNLSLPGPVYQVSFFINNSNQVVLSLVKYKAIH